MPITIQPQPMLKPLLHLNSKCFIQHQSYHSQFPNPLYFLPPTPTVPDLQTVRPTNWADDMNTEASAEESRRANQVQNNLML